MNAAWDRAFDHCLHDRAGRRVSATMRLGIKASTTPPWAQDIGTHFNGDALRDVLSRGECPLMVFDLPAGAPPMEALPRYCWALERHTRQCPLDASDPVESWPAHRKKQLRRAEREGLHVSRCQDADLLVDLHQAARHRKGLNSDGSALRALLTELLAEPDTQGWIVADSKGQNLAGGVFHGTDDNRLIYGFGGQFRTDNPGESSRASVMMIAAAMRHAAQSGKDTFDFGGSMDPGVDRFYAEFGAEKAAKWKVIRCALWLRPLLRFVRPDLFR